MTDFSGLYSVNEMYYMYPVRMPLEASGGTITDIEVEGIVYRLHTFTEGSDSFEVGFVPSSFSGGIDFLVVAGGGSGGNHNTTNANGGGGGGGVLYKESHPITLGSYPITVGEGGVGTTTANPLDPSGDGENSNFGDFIAIGGGGGGGSNSANNPKPGGSGGGAGNYNSDKLAGVALQEDVLGATGYGNPGGTVTINYTGSGGGGAGSAGEGGLAASPGGNGGQGFLCSITGEEIGYAGGGGGGANSSQRAGDGYHGGGRGAGTTDYYAYNKYNGEINSVTKGRGIPTAVKNSGGGGGANSYWAPNGGWSGGGGSGGSGIVIIRYAIGVVV